MNTKLSLINYVLKYKNDKLINDVVDFITNYEIVINSKILENYEFDGENIELSNYVLSYLNDEISDSNIYRLCLDLSVFLSNYSSLIDEYHKLFEEKEQNKIKLLTNI